MTNLNEKQKQFCEQYIIDLNGTQAAIRAGYSKKTANRIASELLSKLDIQKYIEELKNKRSKKIQITQEEVLADLVEIKERCMQARPVTFMGRQVQDHEGNNLWKFDSKGATRAVELIGKHIGFFQEDNKQKQPIVNPVQTVYKTVKDKEEVKKHIKDFIDSD